MDAAEVDVIVTDRSTLGPDLPAVRSFLTCDAKIVPSEPDRRVSHQTEWILLTSGTTGLPKLALHTLDSLSGAIQYASTPAIVWATFYDIRRYGGLQIFLRAILSGASLVLSSAKEPTADYLVRAGAHGVTHISGTPSHWRNELMSPAADRIAPEYIRLSGEIADQGILNQLRAFYPQARISHAFASTEAGVAFDVTDGLAGFAAKFIEQPVAGVEMKVEDGSLRIRSRRNAARYLGTVEKTLRDPDGFVDTGDMLELRGDRYYFVGRRDGVINVGGLKVHPEEVEAVINRHPQVRMCLVHTRKNAITGALVVADIVLDRDLSTAPVGGVRQEIFQLCRDTLARHKVPAMINFVPALMVAKTGKMARQYA
jgi:acyl-coenzyme A synthetase/AMP-(fatty) acid ligase